MSPKIRSALNRSAARIPAPPMSHRQTTSLETIQREERGLPTRTRENPFSTYRSQEGSQRSVVVVVTPRPPPAQDQGQVTPSGPKFRSVLNRSAARIPVPPVSRCQTTSLETTHRKERALGTRTRENHFPTYRSQRGSQRPECSRAVSGGLRRVPTGIQGEAYLLEPGIRV